MTVTRQEPVEFPQPELDRVVQKLLGSALYCSVQKVWCDEMKYMLQVRFNGADAVIHSLPAGEQEKITAEFVAVRKSSGVLDGNQLDASGSAKTVRVSGGQTLVTEGPAVDAGAEVNGYYIYDAPDLAAAIAFAARIPVARMGGTVEVRAMVER